MNVRRPSRGVLLLLGVTLVAFVVTLYGRRLAWPFIGDDYVFLDRALRESFAELWSRQNADFGWYRPWSRDFHFWLVTHVAGVSPPAFRVFGFVLWVGALLMYSGVVRRAAGLSVAVIATLGAASLSLWGTPLLWISGSQDLWMLFFSMASLLLFVSGRHAISAIPLLGALLSKETAVVLPVIALGHALFVERAKLREALWRIRFLLAAFVAWVFIHPSLLSHTAGKAVDSAHASPVMVIVRSLLSTVNLQSWPAPQDLDRVQIVTWVFSAAVLTAAAWWLLRMARREQPTTTPWLWGLWWGVAGLLPLLEPSTGWRAYYFGLGALGLWLALATWLARRPGWAIAAIAVVATLRGASAATPSYEWSESYFIRAGRLLTIIRSEFERRHPTLPPHARIYLARVPNNIGLLAGRRSALQLWYRDTTLSAQFYNHYRPRSAGEPSGPDLFFRFDSVRVLVEVHEGPEDLAAAMRANPEWQPDHEKLSMLLLKSGDIDRAAEEFEKLSLLPDGAQAAVFASVCRLTGGELARSDSLLKSAQARTGRPWADMVAWRQSLLVTMPRRATP